MIFLVSEHWMQLNCKSTANEEEGRFISNYHSPQNNFCNVQWTQMISPGHCAKCMRLIVLDWDDMVHTIDHLIIASAYSTHSHRNWKMILRTKETSIEIGRNILLSLHNPTRIISDNPPLTRISYLVAFHAVSMCRFAVCPLLLFVFSLAPVLFIAFHLNFFSSSK